MDTSLRRNSRRAGTPHQTLHRHISGDDLLTSVNDALDRGTEYLLAQQSPDGYWCAELEGDSILESEYILLLAWLGDEQSEVARKAARYLLKKQRPEGGWSLYPGGPLEISASVKAYFALKLTGHDPDSEPMVRARRAIRDHGGADAVNSFTRFYLALLGQVPYHVCPAVPPEFVLLPPWLPVNMYRISAWSRTIFVPLSIVWAFRPSRPLAKQASIEELFLLPPERWPRLRRPGATDSPPWLSWERFFHTVDHMLKRLERWKLRPLRRRAVRTAERWMIERFDESDGLGAIFPPIIWCVVALRCLGYAKEHPHIQYCLDHLERLIIEEDDSIRLQPCKSPVWDTALSLRALAAAGAQDDRSIGRAVDWLLKKEVRRPGDWRATVNASPGGWFFEHQNVFYPDVDDTIMVMMALREIEQRRNNLQPSSVADRRERDVREACQRGLNWVMAMQNRDGGWGAFDRNNDLEFLCHVPFADHNAMIDPSTPDITARVLECLASFGYTKDHQAVGRAIRYLRRTQEPDGSWYGRWGVNYIYGTWQVLVGLTRIGLDANDPMIERGAEWLISCQQDSGGWGESAASYEDPSRRGVGPATPSQTAWALLGLVATGRHEHPAVRRGVEYLLTCQQSNGDWEENEFTGTGFPRVFYLRYHFYRLYFPLLALAEYRDAACRVDSVPSRSP